MHRVVGEQGSNVKINFVDLGLFSKVIGVVTFLFVLLTLILSPVPSLVVWILYFLILPSLSIYFVFVDKVFSTGV